MELIVELIVISISASVNVQYLSVCNIAKFVICHISDTIMRTETRDVQFTI